MVQWSMEGYITAKDIDEGEISEEIEVNIVGVEEEPTKQFSFDIEITPNPCRKVALIRYSVKNPSLVRLKIYNISGQTVKEIINKEHQPGEYTVCWNGISNSGQRVAPGIYFCSIESKNFKKTKKNNYMAVILRREP